MISTIIQHEIRQTIANAKTWYGFAMLFMIMAITFNWLLNDFLKDQVTDANGMVGITEAVVHPFYAWFGLITLIMIPSITTHYLCAEKARGTIINYYMAPISTTQLFLGKLLAIAILLFITLATLSLIPLTIVMSGTLDIGQFIAIISGVYLMLLVAIAVGFCISAFMHNVLRSTFIILAGLFAYIMLEWAAQFMGSYGLVLQKFALLKPLKSFLAGIISPAFIVYYLAIIAACVLIGSWRLQHGRTHD